MPHPISNHTRLIGYHQIAQTAYLRLQNRFLVEAAPVYIYKRHACNLTFEQWGQQPSNAAQKDLT